VSRPLLTGGAYPQAEFESIYAEQGFGRLHYEEDDALVALEEDGPNPVVAKSLDKKRLPPRAKRKVSWRRVETLRLCCAQNGDFAAAVSRRVALRRGERSTLGTEG
jgi:hypothetical protein